MTVMKRPLGSRNSNINPHGNGYEINTSLPVFCVGKAIGGPLDKVKLSAPEKWDGKIRIKSRTPGELLAAYYPGYYKWGVANPEDFDTELIVSWVWIPEPHKTQEGKNRGHPQPRWHYHR